MRWIEFWALAESFWVPGTLVVLVIALAWVLRIARGNISDVRNEIKSMQLDRMQKQSPEGEGVKPITEEWERFLCREKHGGVVWFPDSLLEQYDATRFDYAERQAMTLYLVGMVLTTLGLIAVIMSTYGMVVGPAPEHVSESLGLLLRAGAVKFVATLGGIVGGAIAAWRIRRWRDAAVDDLRGLRLRALRMASRESRPPDDRGAPTTVKYESLVDAFGAAALNLVNALRADPKYKSGASAREAVEGAES